MAARLMMMFAVMTLELGAGIGLILLTVSEYSYPYHSSARDDLELGAICVAIVAGVIMAWLLTLAVFLRRSARAKANRMIDEARLESARILGEAAEKAMALSSLDSGRCRYCGNPRTGKFCPKCGKAATGAGSGTSAPA